MKNVFKIKNLYLLLVLAILSSCNKDENAGPSPQPATGITISDPNTIVESININTIETDGEEYTFHYRNDGKLGSVNSSFTYSDEWGEIEGQSTHTFNYADNRLISIVKQSSTSYEAVDEEAYSTTHSSTQTFTYNNKNLVSSVEVNSSYQYNEDPEVEEDFTLNREYDAENRLVKQTWVEENEYISFTWNGYNVTKEAHYENAQEDNSQGRIKALGMKKPGSKIFHQRARTKAADLDAEIVISDFDNAPNPLLILGLLNEYISGITISNNNTRSMVYYYENDGEMEIAEKTTLSHTYDQQNRPTSYKVTYIEINEDGEEEAEEGEELNITYRD